MTEQNIQQPKKLNILLIGDSGTDVYEYGHVRRLNPEAPVPIFESAYTETKPGMASNVMKNLEALGCQVTLLSNTPSVKTRLIDIKSKQHIVRIDKDVKSEPIDIVTAIPPIYDAVVFSDYEKGCVSYELVEEIRKSFSGPIFIDTKKTDLARFAGCFIKINKDEYEAAKSLPEGMPSGLIVTLGADGVRYNDILFPAQNIEVVDVCGAGDTFLSAFVYSYLMTHDMGGSIIFAIKASAVTVQHTGCYAPTLWEIK